MDLILITGVLFLCFIVRLIPRLLLPDYFEPDLYAHYGYARSIVNNRYRVPKSLDNLVLPNEYTYPYFYHLVIALAGIRSFLYLDRFIAAIYDTLNCYLLILIGTQFFSPDVVLWSAVVFSFYPALLKINDGPRAYSPNPRLFTQVLFNAHLIFYLQYELNGHVAYLVTAALFISLVLLASKFGSQVIFFSLLMIPVFYPSYAICVAGGVIMSFIISGGKYYGIIRGHVQHSRYLLKYLKNESIGDTESTFNYIKKFGRALKSLPASPGAFMAFFYTEKYWLHIFLSTFFVFIVVIDISLFYEYRWLYLFTVSGFVMFLLTKIKSLLFLGKAERYLEFMIIPAILLFIYRISQYNWLMTTVLIYCFISALYFIRYFLITGKKVAVIRSQLEEGFGMIPGKNSEEVVVWGIASMGHLAFFLTPFKILTISVGNLDEKITSPRIFDLVAGNYPLPSTRFSEVLDNYKVDYVVIESGKLRDYMKLLGHDRLFLDKVELMYTRAEVQFYRVIR